MAQESGFFFNFASSPEPAMGEMVLLHRSASGAFELYRGRRDGSYRVFKALKEEYRGNPLYESMLRKEYQIGYGLEHQFICRTYSYASVPGIGNCIELEWVDGRTLGEFLESKPGNREVKRVFSDICTALEYIHQKQVVHRDLKPENILVTYNGNNVKLIDFGVSDSDSNAILKVPAGTLAFASPELVSGGKVDLRSDIWSLGKILSVYHLFPGVASKCMRRNPEGRYSSASAVRDDLGRRHKCFWVSAVVMLFVAVLLGVRFFTKQTVSDGDYYFKSATEAIINANSAEHE